MSLETEIVLVRPARTGNVAAACRAMKNMGLSRLALVGPPDDIDGAPERALAYGAWDVLDGARRMDDLAAAVSEATLVVGTTGKSSQGAWTPRELAEHAPAGGRLAVVFGPESSGLRQDELARCHRLVHIPAHADHSSLNLAQAVLIVAYELFLRREPPAAETEARVSAGELEVVLADLKEALLGIGFLNPQNPEAVLTELRRMLARGGLTPREVTLLRGLARQIAWAGHRAHNPLA